MNAQIKKIIKKTISPFIPQRLKHIRANVWRIKSYNRGFSTIDCFTKAHFYDFHDGLSSPENFARQFSRMAKKITPISPFGYQYCFDPTHVRNLAKGAMPIASITVDFNKVLDWTAESAEKELKECSDKDFASTELSIIESIKTIGDRIAGINLRDERQKATKAYFPEILHRKPQSFDEALQKILFFDSLFWQADHYHIGLGRLDLILMPYYEADLSSGKITRESAKSLLADFCRTLGSQTASKSPELIGDTGQYILLGGINAQGKPVDNVITELFLEIFAENHFPDPKLILRVNADTPDVIWEKAVKSIASGNGSPLIMNETRVMKGMKDFGYAAEDVWNVGTSACWEPLIIGKSFDQNNSIQNINLCELLTDIILSDKSLTDFETLISEYQKAIDKEIRTLAKDLDFDSSPLFTLFFDDCIKNEKDFTRGGARYAYHGMLAVGLPNAVNSLINIRTLVFDKKIISLDELRDALKSNFTGKHKDLQKLLASGDEKFGKNSELTLDLTNRVMTMVSQSVEKVQINGQKVKVGFSSPAYYNSGSVSCASADGRNAGDPLAVHISPTSSEIDLYEITDFASRLDYSINRLNGNVVDYIVPPAYISNPQKFVAILKDAIKKGVYELQLNVLDKATLVDAKMHPEKYPDLIVRVWGFSAYFNDLPEAYKDNLIERAGTYES